MKLIELKVPVSLQPLSGAFLLLPRLVVLGGLCRESWAGAGDIVLGELGC